MLSLRGKQFLNPLQTLASLRVHAVLHQNLSLQHQVLQSGGPHRRLYCLCGLGCRLLPCRRQARSDRAELDLIQVALQLFQPPLVTRLIRIHFRGPVQALSGFGEVAGLMVKIKKSK